MEYKSPFSGAMMMNIAGYMTDAARHAVLGDVRFDQGRNARGKIGFVLIPNEQTIEDDMTRHMPAGVSADSAR